MCPDRIERIGGWRDARAPTGVRRPRLASTLNPTSPAAPPKGRVALALPVLTAPGVMAPPAAPARARGSGVLVDSYGRAIRDLRVSLTDRCNFRCVYCMERDLPMLPRSELLTRDEIVRVARVAESLGVRKVRLTGGEPTLRADLVPIIEGLRAASRVELAMTTNGARVDAATARRWKAAGLDRVTISIDAVDPGTFARVTRSRSSVGEVLDAIDACASAGLAPVKLNAVLIAGVNQDQALPLAELARRLGVEMRFIEFMPLDAAHAWNRASVVTAQHTRRDIEARYALVPTGEDEASSTAATYRFADGAPGRIGFIAPVSNPFCGACSRLRLTADGKVRPCLFSAREWDLKSMLRSGATDEALRALLVDSAWTKQRGHAINAGGFVAPARTMSAIGG